jgi:hypothetical protein
VYAATNLNDVWLALVSTIYGVCCVAVIAVTAFKRADGHTCPRHAALGSAASAFGRQSQ